MTATYPTRVLLAAVWVVGCGSVAPVEQPDAGPDAADSSADEFDGAQEDVPMEPPADSVDAGCPAPPNGLPSGPLTRNPGNPLLRNGPEAYDYWKTGPRAILIAGLGDYRMWYEAVGSDGITSVAYATSTDGLVWVKQGVVMSPSLSWERSEVSPNSILFEAGLYKLYYHAGGYPDPAGSGRRLGNGLLGYATSVDGLSWSKSPDPLLPLGAPGDFDDDQTAEPRVLRLASGYRMYYTGQNASTGQTSLGMAESPDGITWTKYAGNPILDAAAWGNFWGGAFFFEGDRWHLWHGVASGGGSSLDYMWSLDGIVWTDGPSNPVLIPSSDPNAADYGLVGDSVSGYRDGSFYRILYTGFNWNLLGTEGRFEGICMAWISAACP